MDLVIYLVYFIIFAWILYLIIAAAVKAGVKGALGEFKSDIMKELKMNNIVPVDNNVRNEMNQMVIEQTQGNTEDRIE